VKQIDIDEHDRLKGLTPRRARKIEDLAETEIHAIAQGQVAAAFAYLEPEVEG
jgi:hypothetical protein